MSLVALKQGHPLGQRDKDRLCNDSSISLNNICVYSNFDVCEIDDSL